MLVCLVKKNFDFGHSGCRQAPISTKKRFGQNGGLPSTIFELFLALIMYQDLFSKISNIWATLFCLGEIISKKGTIGTNYSLAKNSCNQRTPCLFDDQMSNLKFWSGMVFILFAKKSDRQHANILIGKCPVNSKSSCPFLKRVWNTKKNIRAIEEFSFQRGSLLNSFTLLCFHNTFLLAYLMEKFY